MARQKRIYFNSAVYHIVFRGNNRQMILKEARDKVALLDTIAKYRQRFGFKLHGFVLMHVRPARGLEVLVLPRGVAGRVSRFEMIVSYYLTVFVFRRGFFTLHRVRVRVAGCGNVV